MEDTYKNYLKQIHRGDLDKSEISNIFKEEIGVNVSSIKKVVAGEENKVYEVTDNNDNQYIIRVTKNMREFYMEGAVMKSCKKIGIPVADNLYIGTKSLSGKNLLINIQTKVRGSTLERGSIDMFKLNKKDLETILFKAGEILHKINSISVQGFGYLNKNFVGENKNFSDQFNEHLKYKNTFIKDLVDSGYNTRLIEQAFIILERENISKYLLKPVLNHGDYGPKHLVVSGDDITCVLDFGESQGNYWGYDVIRWDYWFGDYVGIEALKKGYGENNFDAEFNELARLFGLKLVLDNAWWYLQTGYDGGVKDSLKRVIKYL